MMPTIQDLYIGRRHRTVSNTGLAIGMDYKTNCVGEAKEILPTFIAIL